jgi:hypothetical protein
MQGLETPATGKTHGINSGQLYPASSLSPDPPLFYIKTPKCACTVGKMNMEGGEKKGGGWRKNATCGEKCCFCGGKKISSLVK